MKLLNITSAFFHSGFIAQEVDSVSQASSFISSFVYKPDNNSDPYSLSYAELVVPLVKAVQEQQQMIDTLKQTIYQLLSTTQEKKGDLGENNFNNGDKQSLQNKINIDLKSSDKAILYQNIPNPFGDETTINYYLPETIQNAKMAFYDNMGRIIKDVAITQTGYGSVVINSEKLTNGIYSYGIVVDDKVIDTMKMQRIK